MKNIIFALFTLSLSAPAFALTGTGVRQVIDLQNTQVGGNGCAGVSGNLLAGDILQLRTPSLSSAANQNRKMDRHSCNIAIPFKLHANERLVIAAGRVNLAVGLQKGSVARTNAELFSVGAPSAKAQAIDNGPKNQSSLLTLGGISTACGQSGLLRLNLNQVVTTQGLRSSALINGAALRLQIARCN